MRLRSSWGDVLDRASVRKAVEGAGSVVHLANVVAGRPDTQGAPSTEGQRRRTRILGEAALEARVARFVHVSSVAVYGDGGGGDPAVIDESTPYRPGSNLYAQTKVEGERVLQDLVRNLPLVIVQPAHVYGPHDPGWTLVPLDLIRKNRLILPGGGRAPMQPVYVSDLVRGITRARDHALDHAGSYAGSSVRWRRAGSARRISWPVPSGRPSATTFSISRGWWGAKKIPTLPVWTARAGAAVMEAASKLTGKPPLFTRDQVDYVTRAVIFQDDKARTDLGYRPRVLVHGGMARVETWLHSEGILK